MHGGRIPVGRDLFEWAKEGRERGCGEILFTSMNHDGPKVDTPVKPWSLVG
jgi:cyclase